MLNSHRGMFISKGKFIFILFYHNHFFISNRKPERASKNIDGDPSKLDQNQVTLAGRIDEMQQASKTDWL